MSTGRTKARTRKSGKRKNWQHPMNRTVRVPQQTAVAVALMEMGITNLEEIGRAVGLSTDEVLRIDSVEDPAVRKLCSLGIPYGIYFRLQDKVRCPRCDGFVTIAPCVACDRRQKPAKTES